MRLALSLLWLAAIAPMPAGAVIHVCPMRMTGSLPPDGARDVPTNAVIRVAYALTGRSDEPHALFTASDEQVAGAWELAFEHGQLTSVWVFTPKEPLAPNQAYYLSVPEPRSGRPTWAEVTFTTGERVDLEPPAVPDVIGARYNSGRSRWGRWRYHQLTVSATAEPVWFEADVASDIGFDDVRTVQGHEHRFIDDDFVDRAYEVDTVYVGSGICEGNAKLEPGERWVRVRAIDMAGNVSASTVGERPSACSAVAAPASWIAWMLPLTVLFARRHRNGLFAARGG